MSIIRTLTGERVLKRQPVVIILLAFLVFFSLFTVSCTKRFVGQRVNTYSWCKVYSFPAECSQHDKWFLWNYTIEHGSGDKDFVVKGFADGGSGAAKSIGDLRSEKSNFYIVLILYCTYARKMVNVHLLTRETLFHSHCEGVV